MANLRLRTKFANTNTSLPRSCLARSRRRRIARFTYKVVSRWSQIVTSAFTEHILALLPLCYDVHTATAIAGSRTERALNAMFEHTKSRPKVPIICCRLLLLTVVTRALGHPRFIAQTMTLSNLTHCRPTITTWT